jgi:cysteine desulfuration protein SufE
MSDYPAKLSELMQELSSITDRFERAELLIEIADRFDACKVPPEIAAQPYPEDKSVPSCESEAFVWAVPQADGTLRYYFDVLNPQGLSAMAMSVIVAETLSGLPPAEIARIPEEIVFEIFGREVSMGKGAGLMGILSMVKAYARRYQQS